MSQFKYFPETDTLSIDLSNNPATGGALNAGVDGEDEDMLLSVDKDGRITNITIERASSRVDLSSIKSDDANIIVGGGKISYTASGLARELGVSRHSIQTTLKRMQEAGHTLGVQDKASAPVILSEEDAQAIKKWRKAHPPGRPRAIEV
ncbi:MAG: DUF2283 domain-containing protein [Candidatus Latescibacteria bacterium]|jgi:uncharacterized protein YuzE|nr:DUF2283 domain-containing protein [Candidatus Latescibacterota bacterium]